MDMSPNLKLPYIAAAQAQKHITHNEAIRALDAIVQLAVADRHLTSPPASPASGSRYIVASPATGDWTGKEGQIAAFQDGAWAYFAPLQGWLAWVDDEAALLVFDGTAWATVTGSGGGGGTPAAVNENLLINGDFTLNQRAFAFGALADGAYGVDRWKAVGASDIGWVAATRTLTINAGGLRQVVEPEAFGLATLAGQTLTLSVESPTNGSLGVQVGAQSGVIAVGSGRQSVTVTLGAGETGNINVTLTPQSYPVWFRQVKLEVGAQATAWQPRSLPREEQLAHRYYWSTYNRGVAPGQVSTEGVLMASCITNGVQYHDISCVQFPVRMRATPACTLYAPRNANEPGKCNVDSALAPAALLYLGQSGAGIYVNNSTTNINQFLTVHLVADAEL